MSTERKKADPTTRILSAALREFAVKGFSGARMETIARRAGVNKATIYYHLGGKRALYERVLVEAMREVHCRMEEAVGRARNPRERLRVAVSTMIEMRRNHPHVVAIMYWEFASGGAGIPKELVRDDQVFWDRLQSLIVGDGQDGEGQAGPGMPPEYLMLLAGVFHFGSTEPIRLRAQENGQIELPPEFEMEAVAERVVDFIWRDIQARESAADRGRE